MLLQKELEEAWLRGPGRRPRERIFPADAGRSQVQCSVTGALTASTAGAGWASLAEGLRTAHVPPTLAFRTWFLNARLQLLGRLGSATPEL